MPRNTIGNLHNSLPDLVFVNNLDMAIYRAAAFVDSEGIFHPTLVCLMCGPDRAGPLINLTLEGRIKTYCDCKSVKRSPKYFYKFIDSQRKSATLGVQMPYGNLNASVPFDVSKLFAKCSEKCWMLNYDIFPNVVFSEGEVLRGLQGLRSSCAPGQDIIPACIVKYCAIYLASPLVLLVNLSLSKELHFCLIGRNGGEICDSSGDSFRAPHFLFYLWTTSHLLFKGLIFLCMRTVERSSIQLKICLSISSLGPIYSPKYLHFTRTTVMHCPHFICDRIVETVPSIKDLSVICETKMSFKRWSKLIYCKVGKVHLSSRFLFGHFSFYVRGWICFFPRLNFRGYILANH